MIEIQDICVSYGEKKVLNGISLSFTKGEFTFILGPNGAGKSTLLKSLNRIVGIDTGSIKVKNTLISDYEEKELAKQLAFIPQEFAMQFDYTVYDFLLMGRYPWLDFWGNYKASDHAMVEKYIVRLGLQEFRERFFNQLSGGEKQRVLIARALVQETDIILLDESISFLDINHQIEILRLLQEIRITENKTIIMVSHNLNLAAEFAQRLIFLKNGCVLRAGHPAEVFTAEVLEQAFDMPFRLIENPFTGVQNIVYAGEED